MNHVLEEKKSQKNMLSVSLQRFEQPMDSHSREWTSTYTGVLSPPFSRKVWMTQFSQHMLT